MLKYWLLHGVLAFSFWQCVLATLVLTHFSIIAVTLYLHRSQAHRAVDFHPAVAHIFRFWLWLATGMVTKEWVAVHRKHHACDEGPDDPHSPIQKGINRVLFLGVLLYRDAASDPAVMEQYGKGVPDDWVERKVYSPYNWAGIVIMLGLDLVLFGVYGSLVWLVQMLWIPFWAAGVINGLAHYWGYRNYEPQDASRNLIPWGIIIGGEELHNNHHAFSTSAKFSAKAWELDIGWVYLKLLSALKLAYIKRVIPQLPEASEEAVKEDGVAKVLLRNRMQVIETYCRDVISPIFREERKRVKLLSFPHDIKMLRHAKKLLVRNRIHIGVRKQAQLDKLLSYRERLKVVYQFRNQLHHICHETQKMSRQEMLDALRLWCKQADESGIWALQRFSNWLQQYLLVEARAV